MSWLVEISAKKSEYGTEQEAKTAFNDLLAKYRWRVGFSGTISLIRQEAGQEPEVMECHIIDDGVPKFQGGKLLEDPDPHLRD